MKRCTRRNLWPRTVPSLRLHTYRVAGRNCHYCYSGGDAAAALSNAKAKAQAISCLNMMKQNGLAYYMYASDDPDGVVVAMVRRLYSRPARSFLSPVTLRTGQTYFGPIFRPPTS